MFEIHDAPDPAPVEAFIAGCIAKPFDDLVLLTGEGLRRLVKLAARLGLEKDFVAAIGKARKFTRGPKPGRALREIGLESQMTTEKPTSEGVAEMLSRLDIKGHRVGLQLYPDKDHSALIGAINRALDFPAGLKQVTRSVQARVRAEFSLPAMVDGGLAAYREALALRKLAQFA